MSKVYLVVNVQTAEVLAAFSEKTKAHEWAAAEKLLPISTTIQAVKLLDA